jgi:hypothetical protein
VWRLKYIYFVLNTIYTIWYRKNTGFFRFWLSKFFFDLYFRNLFLCSKNFENVLGDLVVYKNSKNLKIIISYFCNLVIIYIKSHFKNDAKIWELSTFSWFFFCYYITGNCFSLQDNNIEVELEKKINKEGVPNRFLIIATNTINDNGESKYVADFHHKSEWMNETPITPSSFLATQKLQVQIVAIH